MLGLGEAGNNAEGSAWRQAQRCHGHGRGLFLFLVFLQDSSVMKDSGDAGLLGTSCPWAGGLFFHLPTMVETFQPLLFITISVFNQDVVRWI